MTVPARKTRFIPEAINSVYLLAVCGTGMSALAGMLKESGFEVSGVDENVYPPMSDFLQEIGVPVHIGYDPSHLDSDLVVIGNAMSRGNPEVEAVLARGIPYVSLSFALREFFIRGKYSCVVTGTHGKTTTSSLLSWVLESAGRDPGFFIGGIPENFGRGYKVGGGDHFVSEGDEYDTAFFDKASKFLHYLPNLVILNNVEFDHADIFSNIEEIKTSFQRLIKLIPGNGYLVACWDDPIVRELSRTAFSNVVSFGLTEDADWYPRNIVSDPAGTRFDVFNKSGSYGSFISPLYGEHMVLNTLATIASAHTLGLTLSEIQAGISSFKNVRRRLQFTGDFGDILIFEDFAHHPTAIAATIRAMRARFPERRIWAAFEPRTATSKRSILQDELVEALALADNVILAPLYMEQKVPAAERIDLDSVCERVSSQNQGCWVLPTNAEMVTFLQSHLQAQDLVLFMSNGDFNQIPAKLATVLT